MITNIQLFNFVNVLWYDTMWNLHYAKIKLCVSLYINYTFLNLNCYKNKIKEQICKNSKQETILHEHNILPAHTHTHTLFFSLFFQNTLGWFLHAIRSKDLHTFKENGLHYLILIHHIDFHVSGFKLGPHESWSKHNADALSWHQVFLWLYQDSVKQKTPDHWSNTIAINRV